MKTHKIKINQPVRFAIIFAGLVLLNSLVFAAPAANKTVAAKAPEPEKITAETTDNTILSVVAADWNADKHIDSAVLLKSGDQADLYLYLGNATGDMELKLAKKNIAWSGALDGTLPKLKTAKGGVLLILSENDAIGRNRWHQHISVDYRDNDFAVTGYTYDEQDTLKPEFSLNCDVNLSTGKGIKNKKPFKILPQKINLRDWTAEKAPKECRN